MPPDGDGSVSFNTSTFETGTYVLSVYHDGTYYDPHPVVVQSSGVEISVPERVETAEAITIPVTMRPSELEQPISQVMVVVATTNTTRRYDAARDAETSTSLNSMVESFPPERTPCTQPSRTPKTHLY